MVEMLKMTPLELEAEIMKRFKTVPSCRDIRAEDGSKASRSSHLRGLSDWASCQ
jgi:hypothetical protein